MTSKLMAKLQYLPEHLKTPEVIMATMRKTGEMEYIDPSFITTCRSNIPLIKSCSQSSQQIIVSATKNTPEVSTPVISETQQSNLSPLLDHDEIIEKVPCIRETLDATI